MVHLQPCEQRGVQRELAVDERETRRKMKEERGTKREREREREEEERRAKKTRARRRYDIARCKLQFCCEIIIKYIMPSRLLPHNPPAPLPPFSPPWSTLLLRRRRRSSLRNRETRCEKREREREGEKEKREERRLGVSLKVSSDAYS